MLGIETALVLLADQTSRETALTDLLPVAYQIPLAQLLPSSASERNSSNHRSPPKRKEHLRT